MKISTPKVLIVDDEPHVSDYVAEMLRSVKFSVELQASSGKEALDWVESGGKADMAVLDITMPGITGDELIKRLKFRLDNIVIVMLTSRNTLDMVKRCRALGAEGYILKSESEENIRKRLQELWFRRFFKDDQK